MTREQIEQIRVTYHLRDMRGAIPDLLAAAERALLLEDVLAAAKDTRESMAAAKSGRATAAVGIASMANLCAAIDRAEKP